MEDAPRRLALPWIVALGLLVAWVHAPALTAGPFGDDLELLAGLSGKGPASLYRVPHLDGRPLAALSLFLSRSIWTAEKVWTPQAATWLRLENLAVLLVVALGLRLVVRRALAPWVDDDSARAGGLAAAVLLLVHPLPVAAVPQLHLRGELLALAFGLFGAAALLRARQDRDHPAAGRLGRAFLLATLAGLCGRWALYLPPLYGILEAASGRRFRAPGQRARTALLTALLCAVCVSLEYALRVRLAPEEARTFQELSAHLLAIPLTAEKVGVLLMPAPLESLGPLSILAALLSLALLLHPAFIAGRTAPRFWGRATLGWGAAVLLALLLDADTRAASFSLDGAENLLLASVVLCAGLGVTVTAVPDLRRRLLPTLVVPIFAWLAHGVAAPLGEAGRAVDGARADLERAAAEAGFEATWVLVEDPAQPLLVPRDPSLLLSRRLAEGGPDLGGAEAPRVRLLEPGDLGRALCGDLGVRWRSEGLGLLVPRALLGATGTGRLLLRPQPSQDLLPARWLGTAADAISQVVPARTAHLRVAVPPSLPGEDPPRVEWSTTAGWAGSRTGAWVRTREGVFACFDLRSELTWVLAEGLAELRLVGPLAGRSLEVSARPWPLPPEATPRRSDAGWRLDLAAFDAPAGGHEGAEVVWRLRWTDAVGSTLGEELLPAEGGEPLEVRDRTGAARWSLELEVGGVAVAGAQGAR